MIDGAAAIMVAAVSMCSCGPIRGLPPKVDSATEIVHLDSSVR